jgi:hypothetical protein
LVDEANCHQGCVAFWLVFRTGMIFPPEINSIFLSNSPLKGKYKILPVIV